MRTLAMALALVMVLGMLPTGLLSLTAAAATDTVEKTIYVATTGSDTEGDGSEGKPYASIQKAVNQVGEDNTTHTTILIADGYYNVYVPANSDENPNLNDVMPNDKYGHNLIIAKSNLTLKAVNSQKVVIYGYVDAKLTGSNVHIEGHVINIRKSENVTFDGLVILPHFVTSTSGITKGTMTVAEANALAKTALNNDTAKVIDADDAATLYYASGNPMIRTDSNAVTPANGDVLTTSGLTFKDCYFATPGSLSPLKLDAQTTGDYHFIGNTFFYNLAIAGAGNDATVQSEIKDNLFIVRTQGNPRKILLSDAITKLPVIEGNKFKSLEQNLAANYDVFQNSSDAKYSAGELAVMCLTNGVVMFKSGDNEYLKYTATDTQKLTVTSTEPDKTIDSQEELAYWLTQEGDCVLATDISVNKDILPKEITADLVSGDYKITKDAANEDISAPNGYTWLNGTTLVAHTHETDTTAWLTNDTYHWHACSALVEGVACVEKLDKQAHILAEDDHNCMTAEMCTVCQVRPNQPQSAHDFDDDCTTADVCKNPNCEQKAEAAFFHSFTDGSDTTCNGENCSTTREPVEGRIIYVAVGGSDETGDGSATNPYASIQAAVNDVPENNTVPTTILIGDGAYNVRVEAHSEENPSPNDAMPTDSYGHNLVIAKSNLTLKALNTQKVVIYGYSATQEIIYLANGTTSVHTDGHVINIRKSENVTFDGLVILPHFVTTIASGLTKSSTTAADINALVKGFLGTSVGDVIDADGATTLYFATGNSMIRANANTATPSNGSVSKTSGLTFKNCYFNTVGNQAAIELDSHNAGDYHIVDNTFNGSEPSSAKKIITISGAGNDATVQNEICNNRIIGKNRQIGLSGDIKQLPVIEGNVFQGAWGNTSKVITVASDLKYTIGEMAVMALTNFVERTSSPAYLKRTESELVVAGATSVDNTIDTEEELIYWMGKGDVTLGGDVEITQDILPAEITVNLDFGSFKIEKAADLDVPAPAGYTWMNKTTLTPHDHDFQEDVWAVDHQYHWHPCATTGCYAQYEKVTHDVVDDFDCTSAEFCAVCGQEPMAAQPDHVFDDDCTSNDQCQNPGCAVRAGKNEFHTFTDKYDATCDIPGCSHEREVLKEIFIYVATTGSDETGDGSQAKPYATIQRAVKDVPTNNTTPTTILIADGLYNVFLDKYSPLRKGPNGNTLLLSKSNLTLKAQNPRKVVIYGYSDASENKYDHYNNYVIRIDNSKNLTLDGLIILPNFTTAEISSSWNSVNADTYNNLLRSLLGDMEMADVFVGDADGKIYCNDSQSTMIYTGTMNGYALPTNGTMTTVSGLTFKNCYLNSGACSYAISLDGANITGDYHFIDNTIDGTINIKSAGNSATVQSEIRNNIITKQIKFSASTTALPVIEGNTFKAASGNIGDTTTLMNFGSSSTMYAKYTDGELAVMCQKNYLGNTNTVVYLHRSGFTIKATGTASKVDTTINTEEELAYWLTQEGTYTLNGNVENSVIELTEALPENMQGKLELGNVTVIKPAGLKSHAPEGFCWVEGEDNATLQKHTKSEKRTQVAQEDGSFIHYFYCTNCQLELDGREECVAKAVTVPDCTQDVVCETCEGVMVAGISHTLGKAEAIEDTNAPSTKHKQTCSVCEKIVESDHSATDDGNCLTADVCICGKVVNEAKEAHSYKQVMHNASGHWSECEWCESTTKVAPHTGGVATCNRRAICSVCSSGYGELNPDNHSFTNYISDNNATCVLNGTKTAKCNGCSATNTVTDENSTIAHNFEGQAWKAHEAGHYKECVNFANCGAISEKVAHSGGTANCSVQAKCEVCGASYGELAADVHSFTNYISDENATCVADGTKTAKCDDCSVATDSVADAGSMLPHSYTNYVSNNDAACLVDGTKTAACDYNCGATDTVEDLGSALTHSFTNFVSDGNATCTADGTKTAVCDNGCGAKETMEDPGSATDHNFDGKEWVSNKTGHWVRCECGEKSLYAHTPVVNGAKEATVDETGYTGDTSCEICGYQIERGAIIAKLPAAQAEGLSTGAIVAIVVASVAAVGLIGFAGYWFLIKKKP